jgi:hypothetical protein
MTDSIEQLRDVLERAPVIGNFHPLMPLCLSADVEVVVNAETLTEQLDDLVSHPVRPVIITTFDLDYADRFLVWDIPHCPSPEAVDQALPDRLDYARSHLVTLQGVAGRIVSDVRQKDYQTVALLLVDGLSYDDTLEWPEHPEPCFVDGPSITFARTPEKGILPDVGFPAIIGCPPLARRLAETGIPHSRGYSYWDREKNDVSALLFQGVPLTRVSGMAEALDLLAPVKLSGIYLQLVREGLDGLAHRRREVTPDEVQATVKAIYNDYRRLVDLLADSGLRGAVYLTADHGILWKKQHELRQLEDCRSQHPRYALECPSEEPGIVSKFETSSQAFYLFHHPHLGARIRSNDSGVHGGLSYWESIVPFVRVEVNL